MAEGAEAEDEIQFLRTVSVCLQFSLSVSVSGVCVGVVSVGERQALRKHPSGVLRCLRSPVRVVYRKLRQAQCRMTARAAVLQPRCIHQPFSHRVMSAYALSNACKLMND